MKRRLGLFFSVVVLLLLPTVGVKGAATDSWDDWDDVVHVSDVDGDYPHYFTQSDEGWYTAVESNYHDHNYTLDTCDIDRVTLTAVDGTNGWAKIRFRSSYFSQVNISVRASFFSADLLPTPTDLSFGALVTSSWSSNATTEAFMESEGLTYWNATNYLQRTTLYEIGDWTNPILVGGTGYGCTITVEEIQQGHTCNEPAYWNYYPAHSVVGSELWLRVYSSVYYAQYDTAFYAVEATQNTSAGYYRDVYCSPALYAHWFGTERPVPLRPESPTEEEPTVDYVAVLIGIGALVGVVLLILYNVILTKRGGKSKR